MTISLCMFLVHACSEGDDAEIIRRLIREGAHLGEAHDLGGIFELTSDDFVALPGNLGARETKRVLWLAFNYYKDFRILFPRPDVEVGRDGRSASAVFPFLIVKKGNPLPELKRLYNDPRLWVEKVGESADLYRLQLDWAKKEDHWSVKKALLERFTGLYFRQ